MKTLQSSQPALGLWLSLASAYSAEVLAEANLDWLLIDGEHAPNEVTTVLAQLQAMRGCAADVVVRVPCDEPWVIKRFLDIGVRNLMVPMIDTPEQATELVRSVRYPTAGRRGVATSTSRASRFGRERDYLAKADDGIFVIAQIETPLAVSNLRGIVGTDGIDAVFIGPSDLSANLGHLGRVAAPEVQQTIRHCLTECKEMGVPAGIIAGTPTEAAAYVRLGAQFVAIGSDISLLAAGADRIVTEGRAAVLRALTEG